MLVMANRTVKLFLLLLTLCTVASSEAKARFQCTRYQLKCSIIPEEYSLSAEALLRFVCLAPNVDTLEFSLNENFSVQSASLNGIQSHSLIRGPIGGDGRLYKLISTNKLPLGDTVLLSIAYAGSLDSALEFGIISPGITELSMYVNWFPSLSSTDYSETRTDFSLTFPAQYEFTSGGLLVADELREGKRVKRWLNEGELWLDFVVIASNHMKLERMSPHRYIFYSDEIERRDLLQMIDYSTECINYYTTLYGPSRLRKDITIVSLPIERKSTVAYFRSTLFVYTRSYLQSGYASWQFNKTLFHEIAHFFWIITSNSVRPPDSWIDEGLAEYSAWLAVGHIFGDDYFNKCLTQASNTILKKPRVFLTHSAQDDYFYAFVPYVYHMMRFDLGDSLFFTMLKELHSTIGTKANTSPQAFIDSIHQFTHIPIDTFLQQWFSRDTFPDLTFSFQQDSLSANNYRVRVRIAQRQAQIFNTPVAVVLRFASGVNEMHKILIKDRVQSFEFLIQTRLKQVDLNPEKSIIATVIRQ